MYFACKSFAPESHVDAYFYNCDVPQNINEQYARFRCRAITKPTSCLPGPQQFQLYRLSAKERTALFYTYEHVLAN